MIKTQVGGLNLLMVEMERKRQDATGDIKKKELIDLWLVIERGKEEKMTPYDDKSNRHLYLCVYPIVNQQQTQSK